MSPDFYTPLDYAIACLEEAREAYKEKFDFDLRDDYYKVHFDSKEERDNKFDEYITAWEMALKGDRKHD